MLSYILFNQAIFNSNGTKAVEDKQIRLLFSHNNAQRITSGNFIARALNEIDVVIEL